MPQRAILNGESFYAWNLKEPDRKSEFTCPTCGEPFVIVLPSLDIVKHFRHKSGASHDWKPETQAHLNMKRDLMDLALSYGYPCELEVKIPHEGVYRIADILIQEKIVVECQCSRISIKEYEERTRFYQDNNYQIIWLLGDRGTTGLDLRIHQDFFDVFYYFEDNIDNDEGTALTLKDLIYLTSESILKEKREVKKAQLAKEHLIESKIRILDNRLKKEHIRSQEQERIQSQDWRNSWGANGWFTKPIILPRRMRARLK